MVIKQVQNLLSLIYLKLSGILFFFLTKQCQHPTSSRLDWLIFTELAFDMRTISMYLLWNNPTCQPGYFCQKISILADWTRINEKPGFVTNVILSLDLHQKYFYASQCDSILIFGQNTDQSWLISQYLTCCSNWLTVLVMVKEAGWFIY